ncbi:Protein rds1 [Grifola frondosa]|uniref:Protein rds1 n=1 Tax=Grifola frondosa TaxID=5627 RepID=A0A1C7MJW9_GRIFR|nr:Protein rds1 [Grifola frondosa]
MLDFLPAIVLLLGGSSVVLSAPAPAPINDISILQYALTLEHLENNFYNTGLAKFDEQAFTDAGFPSWVHGRFLQIAEHEAEHVQYLETALGNSSTQPCNYSFPFTDLKSFVGLAMALETVGGSAYLGAAPLITDKAILTVAGSILAVESRHAGWISSAALHIQPWDGPFETPLGLDGVFSLASQFIVVCPATNPTLPVQTFPALNVSNTSPQLGSTITATFSNPQNITPTFLSWFDGLNITFTLINADGSTQVPQNLAGTVYAGAVSSNTTAPSNITMLSGLAIFEFPFGA